MTRRGAIPAAVAALVVVGAIAGFFITRDAAQPDPKVASVVAETSAANATAQLEAQARLLTTASAAIDNNVNQPASQLTGPLASVAPRGAQLAVIRPQPGGGYEVFSAGPKPLDPTTLGRLADFGNDSLLLDLAVDEGAAKSAVNTGQGVLVTVQPVYGSAVPADVTARRAGIRGFLASIEPTTAVIGVDPASWPAGDVAVRVIEGPNVVAQAGGGGDRAAAPESAPRVAVSANGVSWEVQSWSTAGTSWWPWAILVGGIAIAIAVALLALVSERRSRVAARESMARAHELALVARIGPLLQQSLDLGDVLPAFVLEVSDELGLEGMSVSVADDDGRLNRAFSLGPEAGTIPAVAGDLRPAPTSVAPGDVVVVPLRRTGRVVGALAARARDGLEPPQMETLRAVANLLAAALGNVRLFREEQDMVTRLRELDALKTSFIGTVSHELRTTVTAIDGFSRLLEADDGSLPDAQRIDYIQRIKRNAGSLSRLVEDLLDFARFERSNISIALTHVDLSQLVPDVVDQVTSILRDHPLSASVEPGVVAVADPMAVERILGNLLSNAAKYSPSGAAVEVTVRRGPHDTAIVSVVDHGPGIPSEERDRIFELFYRADTEAGRATRGVGIGLAIARQLANRMHGDLAVDETPGGGASFSMTIPLAVDGVVPAGEPLAPSVSTG